MHERRQLTVEGLTLAYAQAGEGRPVVLLHGALTSLDDMMIALGDVLSDGRQVIAFDRPGNGSSERSATSGSLWVQARLIKRGLEALGVRRPILVGHSLGGAVAMAMAALAPEDVAGVVALGPIAFPEARLEMLLFGPRATPVVGDAASYAAMPIDALIMPVLWRGMFAPQTLPDAFRAAYPTDQAGERARLRAVGEEAAWLVADMTRLATTFAVCRTPVHVLCGDADLVVNPALHGRLLARVAPQATFRAAAGVGHMVHHIRPDLVLDAVLDLERAAVIA